MMVTDLRCWWQNHYVGDFFSLCWWFFQCIKSVTNIPDRPPTFQTCHQHIWSPTSVTNIDVTQMSPWQVDNNRYYLSRMGGEMHGYLMGNCEHSTVGHSLTNRNIFRSVIAWFRAIVTKNERPKISWSEDIFTLPSGEEFKSTELYIDSNIKPVDGKILVFSSLVQNGRPLKWTVARKWTVCPKVDGLSKSGRSWAKLDVHFGPRPSFLVVWTV